MASLSYLGLLLGFFALHTLLPKPSFTANADFFQGYRWDAVPDPLNPGSVRLQPFWQPNARAPWQQVVNFYPAQVYLEYNCYYMKEAHTWSSRHVCPEPDQKLPFRHDGEWPHIALEKAGKLYIQDEKDQAGNILKFSNIRWSCDEFPPATWVEGGSGANLPGNHLYNPGDAYTRCAAMRCMRGPIVTGSPVKAEQDWQGMSHLKLRDVLENLARSRLNEFPFFDNRQSVVLFHLRTKNQADGVSARVVTIRELGISLPANVEYISQSKRSLHQSQLDFMHLASTVSLDELIMSGNATQNLILANSSLSTRPSQSGYAGGVMPEALMNMAMPVSAANASSDLEPHSVPAAQNVTTYPVPGLRKKAMDPGMPLRAMDLNDKSVTNPSPLSEGPVPLVSNVTISELKKARKIVDAAIEEASRRNQARLENPRKNRHRHRESPHTSTHSRRYLTDEAEAPSLLEITDEIADAAALVSEANALEEGGVRRRAGASSDSFWMEHIQRKGTVPWGDDANYKVFRNVREYGAVGDGVTDDTRAIKRAMTEGRRCGKGCNGSTTKNAIIYFPPGTYRVSTTIALPFGTQVIGDANDWPLLIAARNFVGLGVLSTDEYTGNGQGIDGNAQEWFVNTANFYRQIRNLRIDIQATRHGLKAVCLHYQVAQATSVQDVELIAKPGSDQRGIFAENGSGGVISDITFRGGAHGIFGGSQQFTAQRLTFDGCGIGVQVIWDWGWVWKSITMRNTKIGFKLLPEDKDEKKSKAASLKEQTVDGNIGSASFYDSTFENVGTAIEIAPPNSKPESGSTGLVIENVEFRGVAKAVADSVGNEVLHASGTVEHWALGPVYSLQGTRDFSQGQRTRGFIRPPGLLDSKGRYYERAKPQYGQRPVGDFLHVKDFGARGDGVTDDTTALQAALDASKGSHKILFIDAGSYILTRTVTIPPDTKIVGETWSQLVASGPAFEDANNPQVMIKVGKRGDVGDVEMQDIIFTNIGATAGLVLVEWNIRARDQGSAALWDCHVRIGGATGTKLTPAECPPVTSGINHGCKAASLMMHITETASGYFDNMWLWVADHMIDDPDWQDANNTMVQTSIYAARGLLVESQAPLWLYGTASEHAVYYQYNFNKAVNVFAGMIQTESPYYQPMPCPPEPFEGALGKFSGDPKYHCKEVAAADQDFSGCDESWGIIMRKSANVFIAAAGIYSWFSTYSQDCIDSQACQKALILLADNYANIRISHLITIGAKYMVVQDGVGIPAKDNLNVKGHPRWSQISILDVGSRGGQVSNMIWIDPIIWKMDKPAFTCSFPCTAKLPPWTRATTVVDYPTVTLSHGTWTSTITVPPLTISRWAFDVVTIAKGGAAESHLTAVLATSTWPAVVYRGQDGQTSSTTPSEAFPTPPPLIDSSKGNSQGLQKRAKLGQPLKAVHGMMDSPVVPSCSFWDQSCATSPFVYQAAPNPGDRHPFSDSHDEEEEVKCPAPRSTTETKEPTPTSDPPKAAPKVVLRHRLADPRKNDLSCYHRGHMTTHERINYAVHNFCTALGNQASEFEANEKPWKFDYHSDFGSDNILRQETRIEMNFELDKGCKWSYSYNDCKRYMLIPVDACNCAGENSKQGGLAWNDCMHWRLDPNVK